MKNSFSIFLLAFFGLNATVDGQNIVINEFMASNDSLSTITDEFGETDDWVELHNLTNSTIDLSGYGLSDDFTLLFKWVFPDGIFIPANGYLIIWTDDDDEQGDLHTNYKLNKQGERIALTDPTGVVLDSISYDLQESNVSMARIPNGTGPFIQQAPTFNGNNGGTVATVEFGSKDYKLYPTIASSSVFLENFVEVTQDVQLKVYSLDGRKLLEKNEVMTPFSTTEVNIQSLNSGSYLLLLRSKNNNLITFYFQKQ